MAHRFKRANRPLALRDVGGDVENTLHDLPDPLIGFAGKPCCEMRRLNELTPRRWLKPAFARLCQSFPGVLAMPIYAHMMQFQQMALTPRGSEVGNSLKN